MPQLKSKSAANRNSGVHQVDSQRASILDAAEKLFLQNGIENTTMGEIARQAGITRVTLYRYFANRDAIAVHIQVRMFNKISSWVASEKEDYTLEGIKQRVRSMIRNFEPLRDAFRYIGMFDKIYLDNAPDTALTRWTKNQLISTWGEKTPRQMAQENPQGSVVPVVMNTTIWFLEKLALRGELTWSAEGVPMEEHLRIFEDLIMSFLDRIADKQPGIQSE